MLFNEELRIHIAAHACGALHEIVAQENFDLLVCGRTERIEPRILEPEAVNGQVYHSVTKPPPLSREHRSQEVLVNFYR